MNASEKRQIIKDLCANLEHFLINRVDLMPEEWDGIEIRQLMADAVNNRFNHRPMERSRMKEYKNTVLVNNLD